MGIQKYARSKILRIMKLTVVFLFVTFLSVSASSLAQKTTIRVNNTSLKQVFREIRQKMGYTFVFNEQIVNKEGKVSLDITSDDIHEILNKCLENTSLNYEIQGDVIVILFQEKQITKEEEKGVVKITGNVKDKNGSPLPGVTVLVKGTTVGVATDVNGNYSIVLPEIKEPVLVFSFIGMKTEEIGANKKVINVVMHESAEQLEEVVVNTGYQTINVRNLTSSVSSVKAEDILVAGMTSIDAALEGRIPDLLLMSNSGEVGSTPRICIRGTSTLLGNREPLWVLDGIILTDPVRVDPTDLNNPDYINIIGNAISGINPQDIERIDVLKDASATALYGTRAANGVIVVTTKKGRSGKARLSYNHTSKLTRRPRYSDRDINLMNSQERVRFGKELTDMHYIFPEGMVMVGYEGAFYRLQTGSSNYEQFMNEVNFYEKVNTDWFDVLTRDAYSHGHNISISGGSDDMRYYTSIGYDRENGVSKTTYTERYTALINLNTELFGKLRLGFQLNGNIQKKNHLMESINTMDYAYNTTRALPCYNEDGSLFFYENRYYSHANHPGKKYRFNILNEINNSSNEYDGEGLSARLDLKYNIMEGWDINVLGSYNRSSTLQEKWWGEKTQYVAMLRDAEVDEKPLTDAEGGYCELPYGGVLLTTNSISSGYTFRVQSDFRHLFGSDVHHLFTVSVGFETNSSKYKSYSDEKRGFMKDRGLQFTDATGITLSDYVRYESWIKKNHLTISDNLTNMLAGYATVSYSYENHFTLNVNGRFDASNKFGSRSNEKFLPVWSVSGMWNGKENLLKNVEFVSNLQLRASFGIQGNMLDDQSPNLIIRKGTIDANYGQNISNVERFPNPNLRWEQTNSLNLTLDVELFASRLAISGSYFLKKTKDCFTDVEISPLNGFYSYVMNNGNLTNKGYNLGISGTPIRTDNFTWQVNTYWSGNYNEVKAQTTEDYSISDYLDGRALMNGKPVGTFYSYKFLGLNPSNGVPVFDDWEERRNQLVGKSLDEVVKLVLEDSGSREPKFFGSFSTSLTYKNVSLQASFVYSLGSKIRLFSLYNPIIEGISSDVNVRKEFTNRWQVSGDELRTNVPVILSPADPDYDNYREHYCKEPGLNIANFASNVWDMYDKSNLRVVSGDYLKCNSITMRYSFSPNLLQKTPFSSAYITLNATNVFTISAKELKGQDPTQAGFAKPNLSIRPAYSLGLNVSF